MLLMYENPRLFTKNNIQTCRNQNQIKMKPKSNTQDNVLQMNMKNMNWGCLKNPTFTVKPKKYILGLQTKLS
jgi:hypothetical protein